METRTYMYFDIFSYGRLRNQRITTLTYSLFLHVISQFCFSLGCYFSFAQLILFFKLHVCIAYWRWLKIWFWKCLMLFIIWNWIIIADNIIFEKDTNLFLDMQW